MGTSFTITVNPVNDAPTMTQPADMQIDEDAAGQTVSLTGITPGPVDEAGQTVAITATSSDPTVIPDPTVTYAGGPTGSLKFTPVANANGTVTITVTVRDDGGGTDTTTYTFNVIVSAEPDAPVMDTSFTPMLPPIKIPIPKNTFPTGAPIGTLVAHVTDNDPGAAKGVAITGLDTKDGTWEFTVDGGAHWNAMPTVSATSALLLVEDGLTQVRFNPHKLAKGIKPFTKGFADLTYRAWDQSAGTAGQLVDPATVATAVSSQSERAWVAVGKTLPTVDSAGHPLLKPIKEDVRQSPALTVKKFLGLLAKETDPTRVFGIALSGTTGTGSWEFNTGKGGWQPLGAVTDTSALLLRPTDRVRFKPGKDFDGDARLTYHTWDMVTGTFGTLANATGAGFSAASETAIMDILAVNDAPVLDTTPSPTFGSVQPGQTTSAMTVSALLNGAATDVDSTSIGIRLLSGTGGTWEYSLNGTDWVKVTKPVFLAPTAQLRFTALATAKPSTATLKFKAWDQFSAKGAVSKASESATATILSL
jgi:hypothetical protein